MKVVESIKKARENNVSDDAILSEIRKQNPEKEQFFVKAQERGASATDILNEIIKQNSVKEEPIPLTPTPEEKPPTPIKIEKDPSPLEKQKLTGKNSKESGVTLLTKEAQEREEKIRENFLKRVEAKERGEFSEGNNIFPSSEATQSSNEEMSTGFDKGVSDQKPPLVLFIVLAFLILGAFILLILNFS